MSSLVTVDMKRSHRYERDKLAVHGRQQTIVAVAMLARGIDGVTASTYRTGGQEVGAAAHTHLLVLVLTSMSHTNFCAY
eukprot:scaffold181857_cov37-Prasinocladus_malaysianus.AAC.1